MLLTWPCIYVYGKRELERLRGSVSVREFQKDLSKLEKERATQTKKKTFYKNGWNAMVFVRLFVLGCFVNLCVRLIQCRHRRRRFASDIFRLI